MNPLELARAGAEKLWDECANVIDNDTMRNFKLNQIKYGFNK